jgi:release factor glutamine methyltransferase
MSRRASAGPDPNVGELLREGRERLAAAEFGIPREAALLLGHVLGLSAAQVMARDEQPMPAVATARLRQLVERRAAGEPVAYLVGEREFYGRRFAVDDRVLIPRPETEHLIEAALALDLPPAPRILDVGTGSGCLAVTLALELPAARVAAGDVSAGALAVAAGNARRLGAAARLRLAASDLTAAFDLAGFDLVVSNPPYVDPADLPVLSPEVCNFEPHLALFAPSRGEAFLRRLIDEGAALRGGAWMVLEIGHGQLAAARHHAAGSALELTAVHDDYAGIPRILVLRRR